MSYELRRAASVGESIDKNEPISGVAVDMTGHGPLTQEAVDTLKEAASILASASPLVNADDGQTSSKALISQEVIC